MAADHGSQWQDAAGRPQLRLLRLPGLGHVWSGAPGVHAHVAAHGPDLTALVLAWLARAWQDGPPSKRS